MIGLICRRPQKFGQFEKNLLPPPRSPVSLSIFAQTLYAFLSPITHHNLNIVCNIIHAHYELKRLLFVLKITFNN
jgi:hypothetical protein